MWAESVRVMTQIMKIIYRFFVSSMFVMHVWHKIPIVKKNWTRRSLYLFPHSGLTGPSHLEHGTQLNVFLTLSTHILFLKEPEYCGTAWVSWSWPFRRRWRVACAASAGTSTATDATTWSADMARCSLPGSSSETLGGSAEERRAR